MELTYLMLTGSLSGLVSVLAHSVVASARAAVRRGRRVPPLQASDALLHMICGTGLRAAVLAELGTGGRGRRAVVGARPVVRQSVLAVARGAERRRRRAGARTAGRDDRRGRVALGDDLPDRRSGLRVELGADAV